eukprot:GHRR01026909.1.p1 GENE.GHRR01026909.1~~GHRR01026909.1.p1  ORF type:complete len:281 (+),score=105.87 GHRR01026909.1:1731-2573(+)
MAVEGLTIFHIKSHLQKYRLNIRLPESAGGGAQPVRSGGSPEPEQPSGVDSAVETHATLAQGSLAATMSGAMSGELPSSLPAAGGSYGGSDVATALQQQQHQQPQRRASWLDTAASSGLTRAMSQGIPMDVYSLAGPALGTASSGALDAQVVGSSSLQQQQQLQQQPQPPQQQQPPGGHDGEDTDAEGKTSTRRDLEQALLLQMELQKKLHEQLEVGPTGRTHAGLALGRCLGSILAMQHPSKVNSSMSADQVVLGPVYACIVCLSIRMRHTNCSIAFAR